MTWRKYELVFTLSAGGLVLPGRSQLMGTISGCNEEKNKNIKKKKDFCLPLKLLIFDYIFNIVSMFCDGIHEKRRGCFLTWIPGIPVSPFSPLMLSPGSPWNQIIRWIWSRHIRTLHIHSRWGYWKCPNWLKQVIFRETTYKHYIKHNCTLTFEPGMPGWPYEHKY